MSWKFIEGITVADVAFSAQGRTLDELFESAAEALTSTMVKDVTSVKTLKKKKITLKAANDEQLLHDFLEELVFLKDAERMLFGKVEVKVDGKKHELSAILRGEVLDMKKHELLVDVKAVTWHEFKLEKDAGGWHCQVVLDV